MMLVKATGETLEKVKEEAVNLVKEECDRKVYIIYCDFQSQSGKPFYYLKRHWQTTLLSYCRKKRQGKKQLMKRPEEKCLLR